MFMLRRRRRRKAFNTRFWRRVVESVRKVHSEITIMPTSKSTNTILLPPAPLPATTMEISQDGGDDADVINDESGDRLTEAIEVFTAASSSSSSGISGYASAMSLRDLDHHYDDEDEDDDDVDCYSDVEEGDEMIDEKAEEFISWILHVLSENQEDPPVIISLNSKTNPQDGAKAATVQLCIKNKCLILQLLHVNQNTNLEECFGDLFRDEKFVFVGIGIAETAKKLNGLVTLVKKVDVRDLVKVNYPISYGVRSRLSLKAMASELLGFAKEGDDKKTFDLLLKQLQDEITPKLLDQLFDPQRRLS
ncbi:hypothetical protein YC2023_121253 [Brassica napus]